MKKKMIIVIVIIAVLVAVGAYILHGLSSIGYFHRDYIKNYEEELGFPIGASPEDVIAVMGEPDEIIKGVTANELQLETLTLKINGVVYEFIQVYSDDRSKTEKILTQYTLESDNIKLGKRKIAVGSSRKEVRKAYGNDGDIKEQKESFRDANQQSIIAFYFDEQDIVTKIVVDVHP